MFWNGKVVLWRAEVYDKLDGLRFGQVYEVGCSALG